MAPPPPPCPPLCAILLDDDLFMAELIGDMLTRFGMKEVYLETNAQHALKTILEHQPDLLICDLAIPDMDGIEFMKSIALHGFQGGIIVLSGMSDAVLKAAQSLALAQGLRVLGAFKKPLSPVDLQLALSKLSMD